LKQEQTPVFQVDISRQ